MNTIKKISLVDLIKKYNLFMLLLFFVLIAVILSPRFLTWQNFFNLLQQSAVGGIVAVGMTFVIITGGIDLSVGSNVALAGMISSILAKDLGCSTFISMFAAIALGAFTGFVTGSIITRFNLPDYIASMAMMISLRGVALLLTNGKPVFGLSDSFRFLGSGFLFDTIPISGIIWIIITCTAAFFLKYTPL